MTARRGVVGISLLLVLLVSPLAAVAQQPAKSARIGFLSAGPNPNMDIFRGLRDLGWIEGQNLSVEYRWAAGRQQQLPALAAELVRLKVDIIVTSSTPAALAAKQATSTIPIVFTFVADPVGSGVQLHFVEVRSAEDLERAFTAVTEARAGALLVSPTPMLFEARSRIVAHAAKSQLPAIYPWREAVEGGGLASYATNFPEMYRRASAYVDKMLKGAKPADLPIEQPARFELVINLRTAKTLGLSIPDSLLQRADEVIR